MTAADKLRELLASRPAMPNTEELVRWWRTSAQLLPDLLDERHSLSQTAKRRLEDMQQLSDDLVAERAKLRREQDARADLRLELDRMRPVYEAALRLRAITKRAEQQATPALLNQQIIENANAFRELFDAVDAVTSGDSSRMPAGARLLVGDREEPVTVVGRTAVGVVTIKVTDPATIALLKKGTTPVSLGYLMGEPATPADDESRCAVCGWSLAGGITQGCTRGNCSLRPRPETLYAPARAAKEATGG